MKTNKKSIQLLLKTIVPSLVVLISLNASAWESAFDCDQGSLSIDQQPSSQSSGVQGQMVFRGSLVKWLVNDLHAIEKSKLNEQGELVLPTAYDEQGRLNPSALNMDSNGNILCLKLIPRENRLELIASQYCVGKPVAQYPFNQCSY